MAVVAAKYFHNNHERALWVLTELGYLSEHLALQTEVARRRRLVTAGGGDSRQLFASGAAFIIDRMPLPVCRRARARRNRKLRGRDYCGYCAAKKEKFFGFRLHLVCTPEGLPISFAIVTRGYHDLTPLHELTFLLPAGECVLAIRATTVHRTNGRSWLRPGCESSPCDARTWRGMNGLWSSTSSGIGKASRRSTLN